MNRFLNDAKAHRPQNSNGARRATGQTESGTSGEAKIILLTDVVEEPALSADSLDPLIGAEDARAMLRGLARARLPELKRRRPGLIRGICRFLFGGQRLSSSDQLHTLMRDLTRANRDATRFVESGAALHAARLGAASTPLRAAAEDEKCRTTIARHQSHRAEYEAHARQTVEPPPTTPTPPPDVVTREHLKAAIESLAASNARAAEDVLKTVEAALETQAKSLTVEIVAVGRGIEGIVGRVDGLERWTHTAAEGYQTLLTRLDEHDAKAVETAGVVESLVEQVAEIQQPAAVRMRKREQELADADHQIELARKRAEISSHQATARRHRERPKTPLEEFANRAREQLRTATSKRRTLDKIRREIDERLRQTAERHGEDSEAYKLERDMYDDLTTDLEELK